MFDVIETRRNNLRALLADYPSQVAFAEAVGKSPQQIGGMLTGTKSFGTKIARELETKLGLELGALDRDGSDRYIRLHRVEEEGAKEDWISVPLLDIEASCGYGADSGYASIVGGIDIAPAFAQTLPGVVSPRGLHVVNAHGDSMEPTIIDRAFCFVDRSQTRVLTDSIFCLMADGQLFIKRLQRNLDGTILMLSDNPLYRPQTIDKATMETTTIIGRVVYVYNGTPL